MSCTCPPLFPSLREVLQSFLSVLLMFGVFVIYALCETYSLRIYFLTLLKSNRGPLQLSSQCQTLSHITIPCTSVSSLTAHRRVLKLRFKEVTAKSHDLFFFPGGGEVKNQGPERTHRVLLVRGLLHRCHNNYRVFTHL